MFRQERKVLVAMFLVFVGMQIPQFAAALPNQPDGFYVSRHSPCTNWTRFNTNQGFQGYACVLWPRQTETLDAENAVNWIKYLKSEIEVLKKQIRELHQSN